MSVLLAASPASVCLAALGAAAPIASSPTWSALGGLAIVLVVLVALYLAVRVYERPSSAADDAPTIAAGTGSADGPGGPGGTQHTYRQLVIYASHIFTVLIVIWMILRLRNHTFGPAVPDREAILRYELEKAKQELEGLKRLLGKPPHSE
jgi:amino acid transporter